ncbi:MAG: MFS transporter [Acidimicrobiales bacterium]
MHEQFRVKEAGGRRAGWTGAQGASIGLDRRDRRLILAAQCLRALAYGYSAVLLGVDLHRRGLSRLEVGLVLSAVVAGSALGLLVVGRIADRVGRRRVYVAGYLILALAGVTLALSPWWWPLAVVALTGTLSAEVMDSGPFTALEQAMLSSLSSGRHRLRGFGMYNAIAAAGGSLGALLAGGMGAAGLVPASSSAPGSGAFLLLVPLAAAGAACAAGLSAAVELHKPPAELCDPTRAGPVTTKPVGGPVAGSPVGGPTLVRDRRDRGRLLPPPSPSRTVILRLSALFGVDSFGAGFTVQAFVAYWLSTRYGASTAVIGILFFGLGVVQTASMLVATRLGERFGLLSTMVFTHLPSNMFLAAVAFAPSLPIAACLLVARSALSQMDVPTRQTYVMTLVPPEDRISAATVTGLARYATRPVGPVLAGLAQGAFVGLPFLIAGTVKGGYDLALWIWFRRVPLPDEPAPTTPAPAEPTRAVPEQPRNNRSARSTP